MLIRYLKVILFLIIVCSSITLSQHSTEPGTLIKISQFENYFNLGTNLIKVGDFDLDMQNEIATKVKLYISHLPLVKNNHVIPFH